MWMTTSGEKERTQIRTKNCTKEYKEKEGMPKGEKLDLGKDRWDLLPIAQVEYIVKVLTYGAKKYSDDNWKYVPDIPNRYYAAVMRHLSQWRKGQQNDDESHLPHLAHACCCLLFLMWDDEKLK